MKKSWTKHKNLSGFYIAPAMAVLILCLILPLFYTIYCSLFKLDYLVNGGFVGMKNYVTFICLFGFVLAGRAQDANTDESSKPVILYSGTPKKYEIADIKVEGVKNYEDYVLIGLSGLSVGQTISVPGDEITSAIKRYWRHGHCCR